MKFMTNSCLKYLELETCETHVRHTSSRSNTEKYYGFILSRFHLTKIWPRQSLVYGHFMDQKKKLFILNMWAPISSHSSSCTTLYS